MGGPDYPGCGVAAGVERIRLLCSKNFKLPVDINYVAIAIGNKNKIRAMKIINKFRDEFEFNKYFSIDFICRDDLSKGLRYASEKKADFALILGDDEILKKEITIKELKSRKQIKINISNLFNYLLEPKKIKF